MEGAKDGRRFRAAVEAAARHKPMVVLKLGRSEFGQRATLAHTGTLAGRHEAFAALFRQNGVALVDSIDALVETAALFDLAPLPQGDRVVMMTVSGGATSLIGDLGEAAGINFPPIREATNAARAENPRRRARLRQSARYRRAAAAAPRRQHHGGAAGAARRRRHRPDRRWCSACGRTAGNSHQDLVDRLAAAARVGAQAGAARLLHVQQPDPALARLFAAPARCRCSRIWSAACRHPPSHRLCGLPPPQRAGPSGDLRAETPAHRRRPRSRAGRVLTEAQSKQILARAGLPVTREPLARSPAEAVRLAAEIGGAVALKIQSADIPHKSDIGGVHLGAVTPAEVESAAAQVLANAGRNCPHAAIDGILVQEMVTDGVEFILGMTYDAPFGPLIVCGAGGVTVEVFKDAAVLLPPLRREDVSAALGAPESVEAARRVSRRAAARCGCAGRLLPALRRVRGGDRRQLRGDRSQSGVRLRPRPRRAHRRCPDGDHALRGESP